MINLIFQFIAAGILILGLKLTGDKRKSGPFLAGLSELIWIPCFIFPYQMWGGVFLSTVLFMVQSRNFIKWNKEGFKW